MGSPRILQRELVLEHDGREWRAAAGTTVQLGRHPRNDVLLSGADVSRFHATIRWEDGRLVLEDRASVNGTRVDGDVIDGPVELLGGERVGIGEHELRVRFEDPARPALLEETADSDEEVVLPGRATCGAFASARAHDPYGELLPSTADLLLAQERLRETVVVELSSGREDARVVIAAGRVVAAACGEREGLVALERILHLSQGTFRVLPRIVPTEGELSVSVAEYLRLGYWEMRLRQTRRWMRATE